MKIQSSLDQYFLKSKNSSCPAPKRTDTLVAPIENVVTVTQQVIPELKKSNADCLLGLTFYIDDSLRSLRKNLVALIIEFRGKISHSYGHNLNFVIMDSLVDAKHMAKAGYYGYRLIRVAQFLEMIRSGTTVENCVKGADEVEEPITAAPLEEDNIALLQANPSKFHENTFKNEIPCLSQSDDDIIDLTMSDDDTVIATNSQPLHGFNFLVMSSLEILRPSECIEKILLLGGNVMNRIEKGINCIVVNQRGARILYKKCIECGIKLIMEQDFDEFLENKKKLAR